VTAQIDRLFLHVAPLLLGLVIGFLAVWWGLRQWLAQSALPTGRDFAGSRVRLARQYIAASIVGTAAAGFWRGRHLPGHTGVETIRGAMWGLPIGMGAALRWVTRRGVR